VSKRIGQKKKKALIVRLNRPHIHQVGTWRWSTGERRRQVAPEKCDRFVLLVYE
jgi:hypothetical protein